MITVFTTLDIRRNASKYAEKNFHTLNQILSMRCQINVLTDPEETSVHKLDTDKPVYSFVFESYTPEVYANFSDPLHYLKADTDGVPLIRSRDGTDYDLELLQIDQNIYYEIRKI